MAKRQFFNAVGIGGTYTGIKDFVISDKHVNPQLVIEDLWVRATYDFLAV